MTLGSGWEERSDLAALLSAGEDRFAASRASSTIEATPSFQITSGLDPSDGANYSGGSSYSADMPLGPSSAGINGMLGANTQHPGVLKLIANAQRYQKRIDGRPYPNVRNQKAIARGYLAPTDFSAKDNLNQGWNAAAQPGAAPGLVVSAPIRDVDAAGGGLTYAQALNYDPAPLTEHLGALRGLGAASVPQQTPGDQSVGARELKLVVLPILLLGGLLAWLASR
jgi:hypothetical protein